MLRLLSIGIDCISSAIFVIPTVLILQYAVFRQRNFKQLIAVLIFAFYSNKNVTRSNVPLPINFK